MHSRSVVPLIDTKKKMEDICVRMTVTARSSSSRLTPTTNMGVLADGAEKMTFFVPPFKWAEAL